MVTCELDSRNMAAPFVVYNGIKLKDAKKKKLHWLGSSVIDVTSQMDVHITWPFRRSICSMTTLPLSTLASFSSYSIPERMSVYPWIWPMLIVVERLRRISRRERRKVG